MTEKRFVAIGVEWTDGFIQDHIGDRDLFNIGAVCNLLNELSDENEQLQFELKECNDNRRFSRRELKKETERIKHIIQEAYETERTAIGKNVLKQLLESMGE